MRVLIALLAAWMLATPARAETEADTEAEAEEPADAAGRHTIVERLDGSTVEGTLVGIAGEALTLETAEGTVVIPVSDVARMSSPPEPEPAPPRRKAIEQYRARRLQLVNDRGRWVGPAALGYPDRDFDTRHNGAGFHVIRVGTPGRRLSLKEFSALTGLPQFDTRLRWLRERNDQRIATGLVLMGIGEMLGTMALALGAAWNHQGYTEGLFAVPILVGGTIGCFVPAAFLLKSSISWRHRLRGRQHRYAWKRSQAWEGVDAHNRRLRQELGLPDDPSLDGPRQ